VVEFTDYQCPFCRRYKQTTFPWLREKYVDRGQVRYVLRDLPLPFHNSARIAAVAARCVADRVPHRFWEFHQAIFQADSGFLPSRLRKFAADAGLSSAAFSQCLVDSSYTMSVSRDLDDATQAGLQATPSFIIGTLQGDSVYGVVVQGALPDSIFSGIIDSLLATRSTISSIAR
jgi:protein-disulfide isomerase